MHGDYRSEFFAMSKLLPKNRHEIKNKLADLGYEWPENEGLSGEILDEVANTRPEREFRMVSAPGWYDSTFVLPDKVFARGNNTPEIYIDPNTDAHVGAFILGEGSLKDWQELVAKPSRQSSCLRLSIAAALGAPFLRPLGLDSFGINWFSETSDGKSHAYSLPRPWPVLWDLTVCRPGPIPKRPSKTKREVYRDCVMPLDETATAKTRYATRKEGSNARISDSKKSSSQVVANIRAQQQAGEQRIPR